MKFIVLALLPFQTFVEAPSFTPKYYDIEFRCLQYALFLSCFFQAFGALFFLLTSFYVLEDKARADRAISGPDEEYSTMETVDDDDEAPIVRNMYVENSAEVGSSDQAQPTAPVQEQN